MLPIVIPYQTSQQNELRYTLRSIQLHYGTPDIFIVGDKTKYKVNHIPFKQDPTQCRNKTVMQKLLLAANTLNSDFIRWSDDIFALQPITSIPAYYQGTMMEASLKCGFLKAQFRLSINNTMRMVGATAPFFDVHTPCPIYHESFKEFCAATVWERYNTHVLRSYYYNWLQTTGEPFIDLKLVRQRTPDEFESLCKERLYVSVGDEMITGNMMKWLESKFPERSMWE